MRCPTCRADSDKVIDSRSTDGAAAIRRRRQCIACGRRFTTKERVEEELRLTVVKADDSRVPYHREKIEEGLERACYKLPITEEQIGQIVDRVEEDLFRNHDREVVGQVAERERVVAQARPGQCVRVQDARLHEVPRGERIPRRGRALMDLTLQRRHRVRPGAGRQQQGCQR